MGLFQLQLFLAQLLLKKISCWICWNILNIDRSVLHLVTAGSRARAEVPSFSSGTFASPDRCSSSVLAAFAAPLEPPLASDYLFGIWKQKLEHVNDLAMAGWHSNGSYCSVASRCRFGVESSIESSRFHRSLFALYSFFLCNSNALRSPSCRVDISLYSFFSATLFCFILLSISCWCLPCK